jgi:hypothetical protein
MDNTSAQLGGSAGHALPRGTSVEDMNAFAARASESSSGVATAPPALLSSVNGFQRLGANAQLP